MTKSFFKIFITGFLSNQRIVDKCFRSISKSKVCVDGYKLDELHIQSTLYNRTDIDELIDFLQISKYAFDRIATEKPVSGELLFNAKCCANCKHFIDKWPYKSECNFHGSKANITHAEEQCCDNWEK